jgi:hypothetical protein
MSDSAIDPGLERQFEVAVERAVRPLVATFGRKRILREELLAHLRCVYFDVLADSSNAAEACELSLARFGNPRELTRELQRSVPQADWLLSKFQWTPRPADLTPCGMLRWLILFTIVFNTVLAAFLCITMLLATGRLQTSPFFGLTVISVCGIVAFYPYQLIAMRLGELSLDRRLAWNRESVRLLLAASLCFPVWLTLVYCGLTDQLVVPWRLLWSSYVAGFALGPISAVLLGRRFAEDRRYIERWALLAIDE